jgi:YD repeat-containing protein
LGRLTSVGRPGVTGGGTTIRYLAFGDIANQRTEVDVSTKTGQAATTVNYFDGRGRTWKTIEQSPLGDTQRLRSRSFVGGSLRERESETHFAAASPFYVERQFDSLGRVIGLARVDSNFALVRQIVAYAFQDDGSILVTDAAGHVNRVYKNGRGLTTRVTDAAGNDTYTRYNAAWLPRRVELPGGATVELAYDGRLRPYSLNDPTASGFRRFIIDDAGNSEWRSTTDRRLQRRRPAGDGTPTIVSIGCTKRSR